MNGAPAAIEDMPGGTLGDWLSAAVRGLEAAEGGGWQAAEDVIRRLFGLVRGGARDKKPDKKSGKESDK